jgi:hypothetical protein
MFQFSFFALEEQLKATSCMINLSIIDIVLYFYCRSSDKKNKNTIQ